MEFESFTYQGKDGQTYLRRWQAFYPDIIPPGNRDITSTFLLTTCPLPV